MLALAQATRRFGSTPTWMTPRKGAAGSRTVVKDLDRVKRHPQGGPPRQVTQRSPSFNSPLTFGGNVDEVIVQLTRIKSIAVGPHALAANTRTSIDCTVALLRADGDALLGKKVALLIFAFLVDGARHAKRLSQLKDALSSTSFVSVVDLVNTYSKDSVIAKVYFGQVESDIYEPGASKPRFTTECKPR